MRPRDLLQPRRLYLSLMTLLLVAAPFASVASAQKADWLDHTTPANWNEPGMTLPIAPPPEVPIDPRVLERERAAETAEEAELVANGWRLFASAQTGWGVRLVQATAGYDGMGRPWGYQVFVFVDGVFAGTLSPDLMNSRFDGAMEDVQLFGASTISADFRRYAPTDPLCCPSGHASAQYTIEWSDAGPLVVVTGAHTSTNTPQPA